MVFAAAGPEENDGEETEADCCEAIDGEETEQEQHVLSCFFWELLAGEEE